MNDVDLRENIDQEAQIIKAYASCKRRFQNDDAHLDPSRWWFLSSAFPMVAGTLGPVASAFSICSLVEPWRQHLMPGEDVQDATFVADPSWMTSVNAIQLAIAIISNMFLLLNMARRVRFSLAQPITIVGWYISAICLLSLDATAAGPLRENIDFTENELIWSQAFYYSIWAATLYFLDGSLMAATFWGASSGHYGKDFILTSSQRTLMLQTILFLTYLLLGALVFSNVEGWNYLDAVYWADVTLFTVGFGDYAPETPLGRALLVPYALIGIISLGLVISSVRSLILQRARRHVAVRMEEKRRSKVVHIMTQRGDDDILEPINAGAEISRTQSNQVPATEFERRKVEFSLMRKIQAQSASRGKWIAMSISTGSWLILWLVGAVVFEKSEKPYQDWSYFDSFHFCFVAWTTIGYGDITPISNAGRSFFVFWSLLALPIITMLIAHASETVVRLIRDITLHLGNITILPGDEDFMTSMRRIIRKITFGRIFTKEPGDIVSELAESAKHTDQRLAEVMAGSYGSPILDGDAPKSQRTQYTHPQSTLDPRVRGSVFQLRNPYNELPTGTDFHFLLITEIRIIIAHLKAPEPYRYTFEQWAWYLRLIGEDERNAETHRKVKPKEKHEEPNTQESEREMRWSWVGSHNPLMGSQEESEWILGKLIDKLQESLWADRRSRAKSPAGAHRKRKYNSCAT